MLLYKKKPSKLSEKEKLNEDIKFFGDRRLKNFFGEEDSHYLRNQNHTYHRFKICKIIDWDEIKTECEFDFPLLKGTQ